MIVKPPPLFWVFQGGIKTSYTKVSLWDFILKCYYLPPSQRERKKQQQLMADESEQLEQGKIQENIESLVDFLSTLESE